MKSPAKRLAQLQSNVALVLAWLAKARLEINRNPSGREWIEPLSECLLRLERLPDDCGDEYVDDLDELPSIGLALLDAEEDLSVGLVPDWMRPALVPASRRPPHSRERRTRGAVVDCVRCLQQIIGYTERQACREVADKLPFEIRVSQEVVRAWTRSGQYEKYGDIIMDEKLPEPPTAVGLLDAMVRACQRISRYPAAHPKTSKKVG